MKWSDSKWFIPLLAASNNAQLSNTVEAQDQSWRIVYGPTYDFLYILKDSDQTVKLSSSNPLSAGDDESINYYPEFQKITPEQVNQAFRQPLLTNNYTLNTEFLEKSTNLPTKIIENGLNCKGLIAKQIEKQMTGINYVCNADGTLNFGIFNQIFNQATLFDSHGLNILFVNAFLNEKVGNMTNGVISMKQMDKPEPLKEAVKAIETAENIRKTYLQNTQEQMDKFEDNLIEDDSYPAPAPTTVEMKTVEIEFDTIEIMDNANSNLVEILEFSDDNEVLEITSGSGASFEQGLSNIGNGLLENLQSAGDSFLMKNGLGIRAEIDDFIEVKEQALKTSIEEGLKMEEIGRGPVSASTEDVQFGETTRQNFKSFGENFVEGFKSQIKDAQNVEIITDFNKNESLMKFRDTFVNQAFNTGYFGTENLIKNSTRISELRTNIKQIIPGQVDEFSSGMGMGDFVDASVNDRKIPELFDSLDALIKSVEVKKQLDDKVTDQEKSDYLKTLLNTGVESVNEIVSEDFNEMVDNVQENDVLDDLKAAFYEFGKRMEGQCENLEKEIKLNHNKSVNICEMSVSVGLINERLEKNFDVKLIQDLDMFIDNLVQKLDPKAATPMSADDEEVPEGVFRTYSTDSLLKKLESETKVDYSDCQKTIDSINNISFKFTGTQIKELEGVCEEISRKNHDFRTLMVNNAPYSVGELTYLDSKTMLNHIDNIEASIETLKNSEDFQRDSSKLQCVQQFLSDCINLIIF